MAEDENKLQEYETEPDIESLKNDFERCRHNLSYYLDINEEARDIRRNNWPGKSKTGRKEGPDSFPWPGASDLEANLVSPLIEGDIAVLKSAINKGNLIAAPTESGDIASASTVTQFMRWRISTMDELQREASVAANYLLETGVAFMGVHFRQEVTRVLKPITLEEIAATSPDLATAIADDEMKESALEFLQGTFPTLSKKRLNKMLRELRKNGSTEMPVDKTVVSRPTVRSYELGRDLIVDSNIMDLESARAIYTVNYFTPEQLRAKVRTDGFDEDFVDEVIENTTGSYDNSYNGNSGDVLIGQNQAPHHYDGLIRLVTAYRRESDEDGIGMCCVTTFSERAETYAKKYIMSVDNGRYPFVVFTREQLSRRLFDSRGYPELLRSMQISVKREMDSRADAASLSTCPPLEYMIGRRPERIGAGSQIPVRRRGEIGYMETPRPHPASMEVEMQIRGLANKLTGRATSEQDAVEANIVRQNLVNTWLQGFSQVLKKMWAMDREYNAEVFFRVTNASQAMNLVMDETAPLYDFTLTFNTINNDEEKVIEKLQSVGQIMAQYDRQGTARYDVFLRTFLDAIDPNLASQLIMPAEEASTKEIIETSNDLAKISSGQVVNAPEGANGQLRLQVIQQYIQGTEQIPGTDVQQRLEQDENFRARMETYSGQLNHQLQQQQNALTGQLGTPPGNVPGSVAA
jgi:hypothetical protein